MLAGIRRGVGSSSGLTVVALTALGAGLRFATLGDQTLWYDEYLSATAASGPLSEVMPHVEHAESSPPVYYYVAWAWTHAFGQSDFVLHSLSALAGTLAIPFAYAAGRELASRRAGVILAALVATSPWLIWYSQEARSYGLLMLFSAASLYFFARARTEPSAWALSGWSVASPLALATHYFAGALITVEAAWLLIGARGRRGAVAVSLIPLIATGLALRPLMLDQADRTRWIEALALGPRVEQVPKLFAIGNSYPPIPVHLVVAAAAVLALLGLWRTRDRGSRQGAAVAAVIAALGACVVAIAVLTGEDFLIARNVIPLWLPLAAVVAIGLAVVRPAWLGAGATAALCALGVGLAIEVFSDWRLQRTDWGTAAELVGPADADGTRLVVARGGYLARPLPRYLPGARPLGFFPTTVSEYVTLDYDGPDRGEHCWWGGGCGMPGAPPPLPLPPGGELISERSGSGFLMRLYRLPRPRALLPQVAEGQYAVQQVPPG